MPRQHPVSLDQTQKPRVSGASFRVSDGTRIRDRLDPKVAKAVVVGGFGEPRRLQFAWPELSFGQVGTGSGTC